MVPGWLIISLLVIVVLIVIFKSQDLVFLFVLMRKYSLTFIIIAMVVFLIFAFSSINSQYDVDYTSFKGVLGAGKIYFVWLKGVFVNLGDATGYFVKQDWFSTNSTS